MPDSAIALPKNNPKGCVNDRELKKNPLEFYIIHDPKNASTNPRAVINIRKQPSIKSSVVHPVYSGNPVMLFSGAKSLSRSPGTVARLVKMYDKSEGWQLAFLDLMGKVSSPFP